MKLIALLLLFTFAWQLFQPTVAMALTTGPSQPEVHGFEPVGTSDMVDMFSGSFVYNIPLLDIEGYPVNISYHGGVNMEQEASWVGLGWNINPGAINRTIRGVPDDFNGDSLFKDFNIKPENTLRVGLGVSAEFAGCGDPSSGGSGGGGSAGVSSTTTSSSIYNVNLSLSTNLNISNYKGVSCDFEFGGGINVFQCASAGVNIGVGSQTGASIDYNANLSFSSSMIVSSQATAGVGGGVGGGYCTRSGLKDIYLNSDVSAGYSELSGRFNSTYTIPIGVKNYVPVITNSSTMNSIHGRIKVGGELWSILIYGNISAMYSSLKFNNDASRGAFGYMYLQNAGLDCRSILDFTRDKDGMFNKSMQYLPPPSMTYDIYSLTGQGTGGIFRPFRNDFGNVYDPFTTSSSSSQGGDAELGLGDLFEVGVDYTNTGTAIRSGPWDKYQRSSTASLGFTGKSNGNLYENVYFKQAGELTEVNPDYFSKIGGMSVITPDDVMKLPQIKPGSDAKRDPRANLIYYHTAKEDTVTGVGTNPNIISYTNDFTGYSSPSHQVIKRIGTGNFQRKKDQISEIVQVQKDGRKYVYGIPAMNNVQREVTFSIDTSSNYVDLGDGIVSFGGTDATANNTRGRDNYYSSTITPSSAHGFLLTDVLSSDYVDLTGNGPSDDDFGSFTKFNYTRTDSDYRWVAPFPSSLTAFNIDRAQYNPGFWSDPRDDKGSFECGSREQWYLHSVETKNFIAEFYTSARADAQGIIQGLGITSPKLNPSEASTLNSPKTSASLSYKLDSIKLFNKHDRFINGSNATPVKSVFFVYDYSLCSGVPNTSGGAGKLTLQKIFFSYGNSKKSMISPYQFGYGHNPNYSLCSKDRWGDYKPNNTVFTNYEFPYVNQNDTANNTYAAAWSLDEIILPSGGIIRANYECSDYAYVQDRPVNEMFTVQGIGNSPSFMHNFYLYSDNNSPNLYTYFLRRRGNELSKLSFAQNYLGLKFKKDSNNCMYFNFNVRLTGASNTYEQIKGYGNVSDIGICSNDTTYGYIKFKPVTPTGGGASLNPVTYTSLNVGRYNLPQIVFPGSDPNETDMNAILAGLKESFNELFGICSNPIIRMVRQDGGQAVNINKSFIRLQSPGLCKKGGGQRVKSLYFCDQWKALAGGNENLAYYGKNYDYTIMDSTYGKISSGVASYEPMIGGDENPLRQPIPYIGQSGSTFPPNDPVDLYQETPIGESLFPSAQVGYSCVTVTSMHADKGKSSQGVDQYQFYTSRDFPAQVKASSIITKNVNYYDFFKQQNICTATQGYTLIFNDMHGKPKKVEHDVYNPASQTLQPISYQVYNYKQANGKLDNNIKCLGYNGTNMEVQEKQLGIEEDVTMDSRQKDEDTHNSTLNSNFNFFFLQVGPFPIPIGIPLGFDWSSDYENEFQSTAVTKVVQQYGILDNVQSYKEGALTTMQNEIYDPNTGQAVVTSTTNEFHDKEYSTNIPASWVYKGMGSSYNNILYTDTGTVTIGPHNIGTLNILNTSPLIAGDELSVSYTDASSQKHNTTVWVLGIIPVHETDTVTEIRTHFHYDSTMKIDTNYLYKHCYDDSDQWIANGASFDLESSDGEHIHGYDSSSGHMNFPDTCVSSSLATFTTFVYFDSIAFLLEQLPSYTVRIDTTEYGITVPVTVSNDTSLNGWITVDGFEFHFYKSIYPSNQTDTIYDTTYHYTLTSISYDTSYPILTPGMCTGLNILPRFPLNTPGWNNGAILSNVEIQVINSGQTNMLNENVESYTSMDYPINTGTNLLNSSLTNLVSLSAKTYADSNTMILHDYIMNADTVNPFTIGERGVWREYCDYGYLTSRNYAGATSRNAGLFNATSMYAPPTGLPATCYLSPFNYFAPNITDPNWHKERVITKYSPYGKEIENIDAVGNYSTAVYGFNQDLPVAVASNARQGEILTDGFEDYNLLQCTNSIFNFIYSPLNNFGIVPLSPPSALYDVLRLTPTDTPTIVSNIAHTGLNSLYIPSVSGSVVYDLTVPVNFNNYSSVVNNYNLYYNPLTAYGFSPANEFLPFEPNPVKSYTLSYWIYQSSSSTITDYSIDAGCGVILVSGAVIPMVKKSNIIDGWQQLEATFTTNVDSSTIKIALPTNYNVDDIRMFPTDANMKSFVYNPYSEKLMATLDENNFATFYEYDQEGNLVRVKKETTKGIMTISESRSGNPKF